MTWMTHLPTYLPIVPIVPSFQMTVSWQSAALDDSSNLVNLFNIGILKLGFEWKFKWNIFGEK